MLPEKQKNAYSEFYKAAHENEFLPRKTTLMIHLASAMALGCKPWMKHYFGVAKKEGISDDELGAVQSIVMAVAAGEVRAQFREARVESKKSQE